METIKEIRDVDSVFTIVTDKQEISIGIEQGQSCCEQYGYFMSEDDLSGFVGADLRGVVVVDTALKAYADLPDMSYGGGVMFVNFDTSAGLLQFVAYNEHNGYYGHAAWVRSAQVTSEETL